MTSPAGRSPAHVAASRGHVAVLEALSELGADLRIPDRLTGARPLHEAAASGRESSVRLLVTMFPDGVNDATSDGFTPALLAAQNAHQNVLDVLDELDGSSQQRRLAATAGATVEFECMDCTFRNVVAATVASSTVCCEMCGGKSLKLLDRRPSPPKPPRPAAGAAAAFPARYMERSASAPSQFIEANLHDSEHETKRSASVSIDTFSDLSGLLDPLQSFSLDEMVSTDESGSSIGGASGSGGGGADKIDGSNATTKAGSFLNAPGSWDFFLSHTQRQVLPKQKFHVIMYACFLLL